MTTAALQGSGQHAHRSAQGLAWCPSRRARAQSCAASERTQPIRVVQAVCLIRMSSYLLLPPIDLRKGQGAAGSFNLAHQRPINASRAQHRSLSKQPLHRSRLRGSLASILQASHPGPSGPPGLACGRPANTLCLNLGAVALPIIGDPVPPPVAQAKAGSPVGAQSSLTQATLAAVKRCSCATGWAWSTGGPICACLWSVSRRALLIPTPGLAASCRRGTYDLQYRAACAKAPGAPAAGHERSLVQHRKERSRSGWFRLFV